ncbi:MAG TPA: hypothetical protein VGC07_06735 [Granulicella sp.]
MLTLVVTSLVAVYLLGPDLISRWILGFVVPRKNLIRSRGEEVTRAVLWAAVPLAIAVFWASVTGVLAHEGRLGDLRIVFSGLYDERFFEAHQNEFFVSLKSVFWMNVSLLWRLYGLVVSFSLLLDGMILRYRWLRNALRWRWAKTVLATIVLPRASEWHVLLSDMLLPSAEQRLRADVLTRSNVLYQGWVQDKMLSADGHLESLTLSDPRRFLREEYKKDAAVTPGLAHDDYWRRIPGNLFVLMGADIVNLNLKYVEENPLAEKPSSEQIELLKRLLDRLKEPE